MAQAKYAARSRAGDPPEQSLPMINEQGREIRGAEIEAEIKSWDLKPDGENLSPSARAATAADRSAMAIAYRLHKRQAAHLIFSVPAHARADAERLRSAVNLALSETVGQAGFRYVSTIHTDHSARPHAHIIIKAQSEPMMIGGREKTSQLRLGPRELEAMRQVFTRHAQEHGLNVIATRREDRQQLRTQILDGTAPLREKMKMHQAMKQTRQGKTFERQAPSWYAEHGFAYERRRLAAASVELGATAAPASMPPERAGGLLGRLMGRLGVRAAAPRPAPGGPENASGADRPRRGYFQNFQNVQRAATKSPAPIGAEARIGEHFGVTHRDPERAAESFRALLREAPRLAIWAANKHPLAFGEPTGAAGPGLAWKDLRELTPIHDPKGRSAPTPSARREDPMLAGERSSIREEAARARARGAGTRSAATVRRSLERLADRLEREVSIDPDARDRAAQIRDVARGMSTGAAPERQQARGDAQRIDTPQKANAALYRELEEQLKRRDADRGRQNARDRGDRGRDS